MCGEMDISKCFSALKLDPQSGIPLYRQIGEFILQLVREKALPPQAKLPPERELSDLLGVSRTTAINTYRYLEKKGIAQTRVGSGTYLIAQDPVSPVSATEASVIPWEQLYLPFPQTPQTSILRELVSANYSGNNISLAAGMPDPAFYPLTIMQGLFGRFSDAYARDFGHIATEGYPPLKKSIAELLSAKGIAAQPEEIMVVSGSQQGLYLLSKVFIRPGDYVMVESPTYIGAIQTFQLAGARLLTVPSSERLDLGLIEDYLIRYRPKLFYILPTYQNPTGRVIPLEERQRLMQLAAKHRLIMIEDDAYGDLYYCGKPPLPLKALDKNGGVIYLSTFSKVLFPGLRTGWVTAPQDVIRRLSLEKQYADLHSNNLVQWLLTHYLNNGYLSDHLKRIREEYRLRRDAACKAIHRYCGTYLQFIPPEGGYYLWCRLASGISPSILLYEAARNGVSFVPGEVFYPNANSPSHIRLCFTTHSPEQLTEGIRRLAQSLKNAARGISQERKITGQSIPLI